MSTRYKPFQNLEWLPKKSVEKTTEKKKPVHTISADRTGVEM